MTDFTLKTTGVATQYLDATGNYSTPAASAVTSVTNSDGTATVSPTTGTVVISRPAITGDISIPSASNASTLATVNSNVGSYTNANITVNAKGLVTAASNGSAGSQTFFGNHITGLFPEQQTGTKIRFYNGSICNGQTNPTSVISLGASYLDVDMTTNGAGGLDTGSLANNTPYYFYMLENTAGTASTIVASASATFGGFTYPTGYSSAVISQIPFAAVYITSLGGFPDFRLQGWPGQSAEVYYHDWNFGSYTILSAGTATTRTAVACYSGTTCFVPATARRALIQYQLKSTGSQADLFFHLDTGSSNSQYIDTVGATSGLKSGGQVWVTLTSAGNFEYYLSGSGANVTLSCIGYAMSSS